MTVHPDRSAVVPLGSAAGMPTWAVCVAGASGLMAAMGIGRFAFTPLLPLMQREGLLGADGGALLAAVNYLGYLLGALTAARVPLAPRSLVLAALALTTVLTAAAAAPAWQHAGPASAAELAAWGVLRGLAGIASAWVLVGISGFAVGTLAQRGRPGAAGAVYGGVGLGITLAGSWVWAFAPHGSSALWLELGAVALALSALVAYLWPSALAGARPVALAQRRAGMPGSWPVVLCYGALGIGYILPATYLPVQARALVDDPQRFGLIWPAFGLAAAASTWLAGRALRRWRRESLWAASHAAMALGCVLPLLSRQGAALAASALLVGGTFMVATMFGLQSARALQPDDPLPLLGRMSAAFSVGQIAGPLAALGLDRLWPAHGLEAALLLAALLLAASAGWLVARPSPSA